MKKWMKFAAKYCHFCEIKRLKKNEKKDFCKFETGNLNVPQKNEIWKTQNSYFSDFEPSCIANWNSNSPKNVICGILRLFAALKMDLHLKGDKT